MLLLNVLLTLSLSTSSLEYHHRLLPTTSSPSSSLPSFLSTFMVVLSVADDDDVDDDDNDTDTDMNPLQIRLFVSLSMKMKRFLCFFSSSSRKFLAKTEGFHLIVA